MLENKNNVISYKLIPARIGTSVYIVEVYTDGTQGFVRRGIAGTPLNYPQRLKQEAIDECERLNKNIK